MDCDRKRKGFFVKRKSKWLFVVVLKIVIAVVLAISLAVSIVYPAVVAQAQESAPAFLDGGFLHLSRLGKGFEDPVAIAGQEVFYSIRRPNGAIFSDLKGFEISYDIKYPLVVSDIQKTTEGHVFSIKIANNCAPLPSPFAGTISFVEVETKEEFSFNIKGEYKSTHVKVVSNYNADKNKSYVFDLSSSPQNSVIMFESDITLSFPESPQKPFCVAYNTAPNRFVADRYSVDDSASWFFRFGSGVLFEEKIDVSVVVLLDIKNPVLYRLKENSYNELEKVEHVEFFRERNGVVASFQTRYLSGTYLLNDGNIKPTQEKTAPSETMATGDEQVHESTYPETQTTPETKEGIEIDESETIVQTGNFLGIRIVIAVAFFLAGGILVYVLHKQR